MGCLRPYLHCNPDGSNPRAYITRNVMGQDGNMRQVPVRVHNDNASLRFLDWIQLDNVLIEVSKERLKAGKDLLESGLVYDLPNGIAKTTIQYQQQSDIGGATISMDGLRRGESDRPVFSLLNFPLPIIHKDFQFSLREVLASRTGFSPLDLTTAKLAARRCMEQFEQLVLGTAASSRMLGVSSYTWGGATIQGYMNFTYRIAFSLTLPTAAGWIPQNTVDDVLQMKKASQATGYHFGPWKLYAGLYWDPYLDDDYKPTYNDTTLRQRLTTIGGIQEIVTVDYIPDQSLLLVQQTEDVVRVVKGLDPVLVQWESDGGFMLNFKYLMLMLPQLRTDINNNTGIIHGS